jgi:hypothetical protein
MARNHISNQGERGVLPCVDFRTKEYEVGIGGRLQIQGNGLRYSIRIYIWHLNDPRSVDRVAFCNTCGRYCANCENFRISQRCNNSPKMWTYIHRMCCTCGCSWWQHYRITQERGQERPNDTEQDIGMSVVLIRVGIERIWSTSRDFLDWID